MLRPSCPYSMQMCMEPSCGTRNCIGRHACTLACPEQQRNIARHCRPCICAIALHSISAELLLSGTVTTTPFYSMLTALMHRRQAAGIIANPRMHLHAQSSVDTKHNAMHRYTKREP